MRKSIKTIVDSIEKEIQYILDNPDTQIYSIERDFKYGNFFFSLLVNEISEYGGEWDEILNHKNIDLEVNSVDVTNENSKVLTNLSAEVFNQLETTYTNY